MDIFIHLKKSFQNLIYVLILHIILSIKELKLNLKNANNIEF